MEAIAHADDASSVEEISPVKKAGVRKKRRKQRDPKRHSRSALAKFDAGDRTPPSRPRDSVERRPMESTPGSIGELDADEHSRGNPPDSVNPSDILHGTHSVDSRGGENDQALDLSKRSCERRIPLPSDPTNPYNGPPTVTPPRDEPVQMPPSPGGQLQSRKRKSTEDSPPEWRHKIFRTNDLDYVNRKLIKRSEYAVAGLQAQQLLPSVVNTNFLPRDELKDSRFSDQEVIPLSIAKCPDTSRTSRRPFPNQHFEERTALLSREINNNSSNRRSPKTHSDSGESDTTQRQSPFPASGGQKGLNRSRRIVANARERNRVHTISAAFEGLRRAVPCYSHNQKLSKLAILRIACSYILALAKLADLDYGPEQETMSFSDCVDLCTMTLQAEGRSKRKKNQD